MVIRKRNHHAWFASVVVVCVGMLGVFVGQVFANTSTSDINSSAQFVSAVQRGATGKDVLAASQLDTEPFRAQFSTDLSTLRFARIKNGFEYYLSIGEDNDLCLHKADLSPQGNTLSGEQTIICAPITGKPEQHVTVSSYNSDGTADLAGIVPDSIQTVQNGTQIDYVQNNVYILTHVRSENYTFNSPTTKPIHTNFKELWQTNITTRDFTSSTTTTDTPTNKSFIEYVHRNQAIAKNGSASDETWGVKTSNKMGIVGIGVIYYKRSSGEVVKKHKGVGLLAEVRRESNAQAYCGNRDTLAVQVGYCRYGIED